jgi:hypothetical protein
VPSHHSGRGEFERGQALGSEGGKRVSNCTSIYAEKPAYDNIFGASIVRAALE